MNERITRQITRCYALLDACLDDLKPIRRQVKNKMEASTAVGYLSLAELAVAKAMAALQSSITGEIEEDEE